MKKFLKFLKEGANLVANGWAENTPLVIVRENARKSEAWCG